MVFSFICRFSRKSARELWRVRKTSPAFGNAKSMVLANGGNRTPGLSIRTFSDWGNGDDIENDADLEEIINSRSVLGHHNVFVLQPEVLGNLRPKSMDYTNAQLQLAESVALVDCLPDWTVCGEMILRTSTPDEVTIFKGERVKKLITAISEHPHATALFISQDRINGLQKQKLMEETKLENIFDRYMLVLEIFRLRAQTKQAKLQVALAEIPYIRSNLKKEIQTFNRQGGGFGAVGGPGETPSELLNRKFKFREQKIKKKLEKLRKKRTEHREIRKRSNLPVVAIVGYTNAGKTTLIKALSNSERLKPKDHLFATLDVTTHAAITSQNMKYLLVDTVGFLSNLPHSLIDAFTATMEDMLQADVIVHVSDVSHPDYKNQKINVLKVLSDLNLPEKLLQNIIEVRNKIDLVPNKEGDFEDQTTSEGPKSFSKTAVKQKRHHLYTKPLSTCSVSATRGTGLDKLDELLHDHMVEVTGVRNMQIRVPASGDHLDWLNEYATVKGFDADGDFHFIIDISISSPMWNKFKSKYHAYKVL